MPTGTGDDVGSAFADDRLAWDAEPAMPRADGDITDVMVH